MKCHACGRELDKDAVYCKYCGTPVLSEKQQDSLEPKEQASLEPEDNLKEQGSLQPTPAPKSHRWILSIVSGVLLLCLIVFWMIPKASDNQAAGTAQEQTADEKVEEVEESEVADDEVVHIHDTYTFGTYEQDNDPSNGAEDIEWIVLDKDGDRLLLISKYALDCQPYNTEETYVTWETCSLREWLNGTFIDTAFSADEAAQIVTTTASADDNFEYSTEDQVFLLSVLESETYLESSVEVTCEPTEYASGQGVYSYKDNCCHWWLRSHGDQSDETANIYPEIYGVHMETPVDSDGIGVRPALWITVTGQTKEEQSSITVGDPSSNSAADSDEELSGVQVGDTYIFGTYEQDNNTSNGAEDIEWIVLNKDGDKLLLVSKYALDCQPYNTSLKYVTWETCSLREWLNGSFVENAFSADEAAQIVTTTVSADYNPNYTTDPGNDTSDQVFILSISEAKTYFTSMSERKCQPTRYALVQHNNKIDSNYWGTDWRWWLRTPGYASSAAADVDPLGSVSTIGDVVDVESYGVRPAIWIEP